MLLMQSYPNYCKYPTFQAIIKFSGHVNYLHIHVSTFIIVGRFWKEFLLTFLSHIQDPDWLPWGFKMAANQVMKREKEKKERTSWG